MTIILGEFGENDNESLKLYTRTRKFIENHQRTEVNNIQMREWLDRDRASRPGAILRSATSRYNCMGMVFASRRTCIDTDQLGLIFKEDGWSKLSDISETTPGDVVVYMDDGDPTHVGTLVGSKFLDGSPNPIHIVLSKWGLHGEYLHKLTEVPRAYGSPDQFWTCKRILI